MNRVGIAPVALTKNTMRNLSIDAGEIRVQRCRASAVRIEIFPLRWSRRRAIQRVPISRRGESAFTLIELISTLLILGALSAVAMPNFVSMTDAAYRAQLAGTAGAFESSVRLANLVCFVHSWANRDNLPNYGAGTLDFNTACYPTDTSGNSNTIANNATRCMRVWSGVLAAYPTITTAASGADYRATAASNVCTFRYLVDSSTTRRFTYNSLTGGVTVVNP